MKRLRIFLGIIIIAILLLLFWQIIEQGYMPSLEKKNTADKSGAQKDKLESNSVVKDSNDIKTKKDDDDDDSKNKDDTKDNSKKTEAINLNNVEMKQIIKKIAEWTGKAVIPYDDKILKQKITIYSPKEVDRETALSLIYSALQSKGYIAQETSNAIYLKPVSKARLGYVTAVSPDQPLAQILDKSQIVEKFFKINNYSITGLQEIITPLIADYGHVTADENSKMLVVIDTVENLMRIEGIIKQLDVEGNEQLVTEVFTLEYGDPSETVRLLHILLDGDSKSRRSKSKRSKKVADKKGEASSVIIAKTYTRLTLIPEPRRRWIIAKGSADDMERVKKWIEKLDTKDNAHADQSVVQIKFVDVTEVAKAVSRTLAEMPETQLKANVVIQPLRKARQIIIFGSEENRRLVENLINEIDLPNSGMFEEKTFQLKFADPDQIKENIEALYGEKQINARYYYRRGNQKKSPDTVKVISYSTLGKVTVIASADNIEKISNQITAWDVPIDTKKQQYQILTLRNSDPVKMAKLLTALFTEKQQRQMPWWWFRGNTSKKKIVGSLYGKLSFEAVPDTKKIIVISKIPEAYDVIKELVNKLDSQEMAEVPRVITLKYADSEDLCEQLNAILNEPGTNATIRRSDRGLSDYNANSENKNASTSSSKSTNSNQNISPWWNSRSGRRNNNSASPTSNLIGKIRFIPVQRSKAILVLAPPEYLDEITSMVAQLDKPGKQVMIKAIIVAVDHSSMTSLGVQLASNPAAFGELGENSVLAIAEMAGGFTRGSFALKGSSDVSALVDFLIKNTNGRILNQPTLWTKDNQEATFFKGQRVAFIESNNTSSEGTATRSQFSYRRVGVTLRVRPSITPESAVDTIINLSISQVEPDLINNNIATSELDTTTHVIVNDGDTIMLGGILSQQDTRIERKLPILGDLPLIGNLFKHYDVGVSNGELIVFITPYVVEEGVDGQEVEKPFSEELKRLDQTRSSLRKSVEKMMQQKEHRTEETVKDEKVTAESKEVEK